MDFGFANFDDDLFDTTDSQSRAKRLEVGSADVIRSYKPKIVYSKKILIDEANDLEDSANLARMKGDLFYFEKKYETSLEMYEKSLEFSYKSTSLNQTIFQRELNESICRCYINLNKKQEALNLLSKLEISAQNFENLSSMLNLALKFFTNLQIQNKSYYDTLINDHLIKICRLIYLHPLFVTIWIQLADTLIYKLGISENDIDDRIAKYLTTCFLIVKELTKHGYMHRSDVVLKQKLLQKEWINKTEEKIKKVSDKNGNLIKLTDSDITKIVDNLELADKQDDNEKLNEARSLTNYFDFKLWSFVS